MMKIIGYARWCLFWREMNWSANPLTCNPQPADLNLQITPAPTQHPNKDSTATITPPKKLINSSESLICNLSKWPISKIEESVLELGLTFCPSQKNFNKEQLTLDFFHFIRLLKLREFFSKNPTSDYYDDQNMTTPDDERSTLNWINRNSEWYSDKVKNNRSEGLVKFIDNITNDLKTHLMKNQNKIWNNLSDEQRKAIVDLANDDSIIIKPADKGSSIVIMNSNDYINACFDTLADPNFYEELPSDPNPDYRAKIDQKIDELLSSELINDFEASKLKSGCCTPKFYGLPKLHKEYDTFPPLRPICSGFSSCTSKIAQFLDAFLEPLAQSNPSYVKDTSDFVQKIESVVAPNVTPSKTFLATMDMSSFYPNIDHQEGINACKSALDTRHNKLIPSSILCDLLMTVLNFNTMKFGD